MRATSRSAASEPKASQATWFRPQGHDRRAWLNAIHVPRWRSLRRCVERGSNALPAFVRLGRPALVRPRLRDTRQCARLGHSHSVTLEYDVRVADRHRDRTPRIAHDIAPLPRACARLEPERAVEPQGTDRSHMRAAVLVDGGQPGRAGVPRVRSWRRPRLGRAPFSSPAFPDLRDRAELDLRSRSLSSEGASRP
jgi:hypothetical protein